MAMAIGRPGLGASRGCRLDLPAAPACPRRGPRGNTGSSVIALPKRTSTHGTLETSHPASLSGLACFRRALRVACRPAGPAPHRPASSNKTPNPLAGLVVSLTGGCALRIPGTTRPFSLLSTLRARVRVGTKRSSLRARSSLWRGQCGRVRWPGGCEAKWSRTLVVDVALLLHGDEGLQLFRDVFAAQARQAAKMAASAAQTARA